MDEIEFVGSDGKQYLISLDDGGELITVTHGGIQVGTISLRAIQYDDWHTQFYVTHLELDACKGRGIGRRCLQLHKECFDAPITAGNGYGVRMDDGSHLVGDGPGFIAKMRSEGLVCREAGEGEL